MKTTDNHIFIGKEDKLNNWAGHKDVDRDELTEEEMGKLTKKVKELIKNYPQLDNVNFLFGTGSSIHLGAASIQNIPSETEKYILDLEDEDLKNDFKSYVEKLQDNMMKKYTPVKDVKFQDDRNWDLIYDGTYIRDYKTLLFLKVKKILQKSIMGKYWLCLNPYLTILLPLHTKKMRSMMKVEEIELES